MTTTTRTPAETYAAPMTTDDRSWDLFSSVTTDPEPAPMTTDDRSWDLFASCDPAIESVFDAPEWDVFR